jgi:hypothetical protein
MQLRVLRDGGGWRVCTDCPEEAQVELERYDDTDRFEAFCLGCLIVKILWLRTLFSTRREPLTAARP